MERNILKGSGFAIGGFFLMALFGIFTKIAYEGGSAIWVSVITYFSGAVALFPILIKNGVSLLESKHYKYLFGRAAFGCLASFLYMLSMHHIPIVNATLLFNTAPIFIPFLAIFWLKIPVSRGIWLAVLLGFIGIIVIIRPSAEIFTQAGNFIGLGAGISLAIAYMLMKLLTPTDSASRIIFYYLSVGTLLQLPLLFFAGPFPPLDSCVYCALSGITLLLSQFMLVRAYMYAEASQVGVFQYSSVVFVGILNWIIWGNIPPPLDLLGVLLVATAGVIIIYSGNNKQTAIKHD